MKKKKVLLTGIFFLIAVKCFGQAANYIKLENIGVSPPTLTPTTIIEENSFYSQQTRIAGFYVTDKQTYEKTKEFIEKYKGFKLYPSDDQGYGVLEISIGIRADTTDNVKEQYFTESPIHSRFFLEDLSKYLSQCQCDAKIIRRMDAYLKAINAGNGW